MDTEASLDLSTGLPLGAGGHSVRLNGRVYELAAAALARRPRCGLYHSALVVRLATTPRSRPSQRLATDSLVVCRLPELVPRVPVLTWGRDESRAGEMWNPNSIVSWLLARSGIGFASLHLPARGRAPGWSAGAVVAQRQRGPGDP